MKNQISGSSREEILKALQDNSGEPACSTSTSGSPTPSADGPEFATGTVTTAADVALMQFALIEAVTDISAYWAQTDGKFSESAILHATVDELLGIEPGMDPEEWPAYFQMRDSVRGLLGRPVKAAS